MTLPPILTRDRVEQRPLNAEETVALAHIKCARERLNVVLNDARQAMAALADSPRVYEEALSELDIFLDTTSSDLFANLAAARAAIQRVPVDEAEAAEDAAANWEDC